MSIKIKFDQINKTDHYRFGSEVVDTDSETLGDLYRSCLKNHGRCIGSCFIEQNGKSVRVGWVFLKREPYSDCNKTFLCETWVSIYADEPKTIRVESFVELD